MLKIFFKKQRQIESLIYDYLNNLKMTEQHFSEALNTCLKNGVCGDFDFLTKQTHKFESKADDIREEIKVLMYGIDPFQKLQLKEMLIHMGEISDQAYRVSK